MSAVVKRVRRVGGEPDCLTALPVEISAQILDALHARDQSSCLALGRESRRLWNTAHQRGLWVWNARVSLTRVRQQSNVFDVSCLLEALLWPDMQGWFDSQQRFVRMRELHLVGALHPVDESSSPVPIRWPTSLTRLHIRRDMDYEAIIGELRWSSLPIHLHTFEFHPVHCTRGWNGVHIDRAILPRTLRVLKGVCLTHLLHNKRNADKDWPPHLTNVAGDGNTSAFGYGALPASVTDFYVWRYRMGSLPANVQRLSVCTAWFDDFQPSSWPNSLVEIDVSDFHSEFLARVPAWPPRLGVLRLNAKTYAWRTHDMMTDTTIHDLWRLHWPPSLQRVEFRFLLCPPLCDMELVGPPPTYWPKDVVFRRWTSETCVFERSVLTTLGRGQ